jgi:hypothetical protein
MTLNGAEGQLTAEKDNRGHVKTLTKQKEIVKAGEGAHILPIFIVSTKDI